MIIGIDPGLKGGVACIANNGELLHACHMPSETADLYKILYDLSKDVSTEFYVEKSQPHRSTKNHKEGITQIFSNGFNYGKLIGCIDIVTMYHYDAKVNEVYPISWKSAFKLSKDKQKSIDLCIDLFPQSKDIVYGVRGGKYDGIAEAILIAYYGYLQYRRRIITKKQ
jgi:hypothetical protein